MDVLNDGEMSKPTYATYVKDRLSGFTGEGSLPPFSVVRRIPGAEFPDFTPQMGRRGGDGRTIKFVTCDGPVTYETTKAVQKDIENLKQAVAKVPAEDVFMSAASPGIIGRFFPNQYYASDDEYLEAIADAMRVRVRGDCQRRVHVADRLSRPGATDSRGSRLGIPQGDRAPGGDPQHCRCEHPGRSYARSRVFGQR